MSAKKWMIANSVAVVLAAVSGGAFAQTATMAPAAPTTNAPATTAPTPTDTQAAAPATTWSATSTSGSWPVDYKVLMNKPYDYTDLKAAKAQGWDDSHIAVFANIAERAGVPFNQILADVNRGASFAALGQKYGLTDHQIYDAQNNITEIKEYKTAYLGVPPPDSNLYAQAVANRDQDLMARALAPSPLPTLAPLPVHTDEVASSTTTTTTTTTVVPTPAPAQTAEAAPAPVPASHPVLAHRTMTKTVRVYTPVRHHRYARISHRHYVRTWRASHRHHIKRYRHHAAPVMGYHRGS